MPYTNFKHLIHVISVKVCIKLLDKDKRLQNQSFIFMTVYPTVDLQVSNKVWRCHQITVAFSEYINFRSVLVHPPKNKCKRKQDVICSVPPPMYALAPQNKIINASWTAVLIISRDWYLLLKNLKDNAKNLKSWRVT